MFGWLSDGQNGLISHTLIGLGIIDSPIGWYSDPDRALLAIVIADVWKTTPFVALLLAGLQTIPRSLARPPPPMGPHRSSTSSMSACRSWRRPS
jgi:multiple sugar transport system permease protein